MLKTLCTFVNINRTRKDLWIKPVQRCSTSTNTVTKNNTKRIFSNKRDYILNILNISNLNVLTRYIQEPYAAKIILYRNENGPFKSLNDLTKIQDIELDVLNSLWISPIDDMQLELRRSMLIPTGKVVMVPDEVLGLHVGFNVISWAVVTSDFKVLCLDFTTWNDTTKKVSYYDLINLAVSTAKMIPSSSSYVVEEFQYLNKIGSGYIAQQRLATALLSCVKILDEQRKEEPSLFNNNFYMLRPQTSAQFFNLVIDKEVVASKYIIGNILSSSKIKPKAFEGIYINDKLRNSLVGITSEQQEQIGWSLLKAITCMYLLKFFNKKQK